PLRLQEFRIRAPDAISDIGIQLARNAAPIVVGLEADDGTCGQPGGGGRGLTVRAHGHWRLRFVLTVVPSSPCSVLHTRRDTKPYLATLGSSPYLARFPTQFRSVSRSERRTLERAAHDGRSKRQNRASIVPSPASIVKPDDVVLA